MEIDRIILVKSKTRLELLLQRFNTKSQVKFYLDHNAGDYKEYEKEHNNFYETFHQVQKVVTSHRKSITLERMFIPSFLFDSKDLVIVVGQDGLVANTAKYVGNNPIMAINPDPERYMGVLLPFNVYNFSEDIKKCLNDVYGMESVALAQAKMNDGQELLAFNDFFIGKSNHTSAQYKISYEGLSEIQSSSGLIVSTGMGSTGWLSSVFNELNGIYKFMGGEPSLPFQLNMNNDELFFIVREPYKSPYTQTSLVAGIINEENALVIESNMPDNGVIFSDGILPDYMVFNSGSRLTITKAKQSVRLVRP